MTSGEYNKILFMVFLVWRIGLHDSVMPKQIMPPWGNMSSCTQNMPLRQTSN